MLEIQNELFKHSGPLSDQQLSIVENHTSRSVEILREAGITNNSWLETVALHHERIDGTGYPRGLTGEEICRTGRKLAIANNYVSRVRPRAYRDPVLHQFILKELLQERGKKVDPKLMREFITCLGLYAPGSLVETTNGDTGIVTGYKSRPDEPEVLIITAKGRTNLLDEPKRIQIDNEQNKIATLLSIADHKSLLDRVGTIWSMRHPAASNSRYIY